MTWTWLRRLVSRRARGGVAPRQVPAIIEAYGACLDGRPRGALHRSERELPYSKEEIGRALLLALRYATAPETIEPLRSGFVELERFLPEDEWPIVEEYQRHAATAQGGAPDGMPPERVEAARRILREIDERRARRLQLLTILDREAAEARGTDT